MVLKIVKLNNILLTSLIKKHKKLIFRSNIDDFYIIRQTRI